MNNVLYLVDSTPCRVSVMGFLKSEGVSDVHSKVLTIPTNGLHFKSSNTLAHASQLDLAHCDKEFHFEFDKDSSELFDYILTNINSIYKSKYTNYSVIDVLDSSLEYFKNKYNSKLKSSDDRYKLILLSKARKDSLIKSNILDDLFDDHSCDIKICFC